MRKILYLFSVIVSLALFSCEDNTYDFPGDSGKVYVRLQPSNLVNSVSNVVDATISKTILGVSGEAVAAFSIRSTMPVGGTLSATCEIDNSLVEGFNAAHGTEYVAMSADKVVFEKQSATIESGQMASADQIVVRVDPAKMNDLDLGDYLIPVKLVSVSGGMAVSSNWNVVYLHVSVVSDATGVPCADRTGWSIAGYSSIDTYEGNLAENVLDGSLSTIWHTEWAYAQPGPPHYISIDMGETKSLAGFQYVTRNNGTGEPTEIIFAVSQDGNVWEDVATYADLPVGANVEFRTLFDKLYEARYFRLTITEIDNGDHFTSLAEVNAFIMNN